MDVFNVVIWFTVLGISSAFLMQDIVNKTSSVTNSGTDTTEESIHALTIFLAEEKRLRYQLEQRLDEAEKKLHLFDQFNDAVTAELQHERDAVRRLEQQLNSTSTIIDTVIATNKRLEQKLNDANSSFEAVIDTNKRLEQMVYNTNSSINTLTAEVRLELQQILNNPNSSIGRNDRMVAFSVDTPVASDRDPLRFTISKFNQGGAYNLSTGKLVCNQPGIYFLTFTLVRIGSNTYEFCCVNVNNANMNHACAMTGSGSGSGSYPSGSRSIIIRLQMNDEVSLKCSEYSFVGESGFTGFLIQAGN